jgi:hypothetical protein
MDNQYVHELESTVGELLDKTHILAKEKDQHEKESKYRQEYLKQVIAYFVDKVSAERSWQILQEVSSLDKEKRFRKPMVLDNEKNLIVDYICQRIK